MASTAPSEVSVPIYTAAPLPPGWTEHRAPTGQFYYYHAESGESTYVRPSIPVLTPKETDPNVAIAGSNPSGGEQKKSSTTSKKKEKPKTKEPIPETVWMKVTTTAGNVFYTNVETKVSSWTVPEEIKEQVKFYEETEARKAEEIRLAELERVRLKAEEDKRIHEAEQRRMIELEVQKVRAEVEAEAELRGLKRKNEQPLDLTLSTTPANPPIGSDDDRKNKVAKLDSATEDEDWQRQIAEEMAHEAAQQSSTSTIPSQPNNPSPVAILSNPPPPAGLSLEELKATFKAMLLEKSINPMAPWDNELPKFVTDPRYLALPSMKERRDLFDEFCKEKIRQERASKSVVPKVNPAQAYKALLLEFVTSTRTLWEDFKGKHKKDPRFRNFGRDDREREKVFKSWLKELGEQKRQQLLKAEEGFRGLLLEKAAADNVEEYKSFMERVKNDPRFLALTSNSSKESMWKKWIEDCRKKAQEDHGKKDEEDKKKEAEEPSSTETQIDSKNGTVDEGTQDPKREKQMASLKAREEQVRGMKEKIAKDAAINRSLVDKDHYGLKP